MKITVVGSGGWGTALAILLHKNGHQVTVWSYSQSEVDYIRENHENALLRGVTVPEDIQLTWRGRTWWSARRLPSPSGKPPGRWRPT